MVVFWVSTHKYIPHATRNVNSPSLSHTHTHTRLFHQSMQTLPNPPLLLHTERCGWTYCQQVMKGDPFEIPDKKQEAAEAADVLISAPGSITRGHPFPSSPVPHPSPLSGHISFVLMRVCLPVPWQEVIRLMRLCSCITRFAMRYSTRMLYSSSLCCVIWTPR